MLEFDLKVLSTMSTEQDSRCVWLSKCVNIEPDSVIFKRCFSLPNPIPTQDLKLTQFPKTRPKRKSAHFTPIQSEPDLMTDMNSD